MIQLKTGQIIRCCNYPSVGASSESAIDPITGKIFLAGSGVTTRFYLDINDSLISSDKVIFILPEHSLPVGPDSFLHNVFAVYDVTNKLWGNTIKWELSGALPFIFTENYLYGWSGVGIRQIKFPELTVEKEVVLPPLPSDSPSWHTTVYGLAKNSTGLYVGWGWRPTVWPPNTTNTRSFLGLAKYDFNLNLIGWYQYQFELHAPVVPTVPPADFHLFVNESAIGVSWYDYFDNDQRFLSSFNLSFTDLLSPSISTGGTGTSGGKGGNSLYYIRSVYQQSIRVYRNDFSAFSIITDTLNLENTFATCESNFVVQASNVSIKIYTYPTTFIETREIIDSNGQLKNG